MKTKYWISILGGILGICAVCIFLFSHIRAVSPRAEIYHNGSLVKVIDLSEITEPTEVILTFDGNENIVLAEHNKISVTSASCPDKLCVKQGCIKNGLYPIVCLPNKIVIKIVNADDSAVDTISK